MAPKKFTVDLDSPTAAYYPSTQVTGRVHLNVNEPKKARGIKVMIMGEAEVRWKDRQANAGGTSGRPHPTYHSKEEYFTNSYYLLGSADSKIEIPPGDHVYPFTTTLPARLPSSFKGRHGYVRYTVQAIVDWPWRFNHTAEKVFSVVNRPIDLNNVAMAKEPVEKETSKTFGCWCCASRPLKLAAQVPFTGVVPGQTLPVTIQVDNASDVNVKSIDCKIIKEIEWIAVMPHKTVTKRDVFQFPETKISCPGVRPSQFLSVKQNVTMPEMPHEDLEACSIIKVKFFLKIVAAMGWMHFSPSLEIPLVVGTVPINGTLTGLSFGKTIEDPRFGAVYGSTQERFGPAQAPQNYPTNPNKGW